MPAANPAREQVHEHRQIHVFVRQMDIRDVTHPDLVRSDNGQVLEPIRIPWKFMLTLRRIAFFMPFFAVYTHFAHHARHAFMVDFDFVIAAELGGHAPHAIGWKLARHRTNLVLQRSLRRDARSIIFGAAPQGEHATEPRYRNLWRQAAHERPFLYDGEVKSRDTFFEASRSRVKRPTCRSSSATRDSRISLSASR